jgi:hypothetical protein
MSDAAEQAADNGQPTFEQASPALDAGAPSGAASPVSTLPAPADERPELVVGAAFAGGLVLALFLKRLAR